MIYNPLAGQINLARPIQQIADLWQRDGWVVTIQPTQAAGHATQLAQTAAQNGHRLVLAAGGDGTLGEVANGLVGTETVLAPLPMGTGNSFARELCLPCPTLQQPLRILEAAQTLKAGKVQQMDMGRLPNGRHWLLWAGVGADSYVVEQIEPRPLWSKQLGRLGYAIQSLSVAPGFRPMQASVEIDGRLFEDEFILVIISNCRLYAGGQVILSPQARLDDGMWEVWLFRGKTVADVFHHLIQAMRGKHLYDRKTTMINGRFVTIHTTPTMPCQTDGDPTGRTPFTSELRPRALHLLVPPTAPPDLFSRPGQSL